MFVKGLEQWGSSDHNYSYLFTSMILHKYTNDVNDGLMTMMMLLREKVWLGWRVEIFLFCETRNYFFAISFFLFCICMKMVMRNFSTSHFKNAFVFVISFEKKKENFLWHPCRLNFSFSFSHNMFFWQMHTQPLNNEVKIAWMCIKCIITTRSRQWWRATYMCDKKCIMAHFCVLMHIKEVEKKIHFIACNYARHALFLLLLLFSIDFSFFHLPFSIMHRFLPSHCDECTASCVHVCNSKVQKHATLH